MAKSWARQTVREVQGWRQWRIATEGYKETATVGYKPATGQGRDIDTAKGCRVEARSSDEVPRNSTPSTRLGS